VSACSSCHGYNGAGGAAVSANRQQKYVYLINQLKNWRDESRATILRDDASDGQELTDSDIDNLATF